MSLKYPNSSTNIARNWISFSGANDDLFYLLKYMRCLILWYRTVVSAEES
ncbi:hypothetical protein [Psychromonas ossibalaenae]|nr:hypothetical protein [Psychromonas ossibalaenae]